MGYWRLRQGAHKFKAHLDFTSLKTKSKKKGWKGRRLGVEDLSRVDEPVGSMASTIPELKQRLDFY